MVNLCFPFQLSSCLMGKHDCLKTSAIIKTLYYYIESYCIQIDTNTTGFYINATKLQMV